MPGWIKPSIPYVQMALSVILVLLIIIQSKGSGLSTVFGGEGNVYSTKRGAERVIFMTTIVFAVVFFGVAILNAYL